MLTLWDYIEAFFIAMVQTFFILLGTVAVVAAAGFTIFKIVSLFV